MVIDRSAAWTAAFLAAVMTASSLGALAWLEAQPRHADEVAVIFPPWLTGDAAALRVAAAGGLVERQGILDTILMVHGADVHLGERLYAAGALAVLDPAAFGACLVPPPAGAS